MKLTQLGLGSTSLDEHDITILNNVVLALGHDLTGSLDSRLIAKLLQGAVVVHNSLNEGLLKVSVDDTGRGGGLGALADSPLANLIRTGSEEAGQVEGLAHGSDDLGQARGGTKLLALLGGSFVTHVGQTLLELSRDGQNGRGGGLLLDPLEQLGKVLVLLADKVLLAEVDKVNDRLGSQKEQRVDDFDLDCNSCQYDRTGKQLRWFCKIRKLQCFFSVQYFNFKMPSNVIIK